MLILRFQKVGGSEGSGEFEKNPWKNVDIKISTVGGSLKSKKK